MTQDQAEFFRGTVLPIIRETAEDREYHGYESNPLRPMLRQLLYYIAWFDQQLTEARASRDRSMEASNADLEKRRECEAQLGSIPPPIIRPSHLSWLEEQITNTHRLKESERTTEHAGVGYPKPDALQEPNLGVHLL